MLIDGRCQPRFRTISRLLEDWFDQTMDRVKGWYKNKMSIITFCIGRFVAIYFNIDTIEIVKILKTKTATRDALITQATIFVDNNPTFNVDNLKQDLEITNNKINSVLSLGSPCQHFESKKEKGFVLLEWLLTLIAISFDTHFWFDLLNKLMRLRSSCPIDRSPPNIENKLVIEKEKSTVIREEINGKYANRNDNKQPLHPLVWCFRFGGTR